MEETIVEYINELANKEFDREWGMEEAAYNDMMMEEYMYETPEEAMEAGQNSPRSYGCGCIDGYVW
jgi:uncharacterized protein YnzC (UPF0291/DUF896 family)